MVQQWGTTFIDFTSCTVLPDGAEAAVSGGAVAAAALRTVQEVSPNSGDTIAVETGTYRLAILGANALAQLSIQLPEPPNASGSLEILVQPAITSLTLVTPAGDALSVPVTAEPISAGSRIFLSKIGGTWL